MAISSELAALIAGVPKNFADPQADFRQARAAFAGVTGFPVSNDVQCTVETFGGVRAGRFSTADTRASERLILHYHGGAFLACALDTYHFFGEMLARQMAGQVLMPDYRLAPENPYPAAHDDSFNAYKGLLDSGLDPKKIAVVGESCGGSLGLAALVRARDAGLPMPACFISIGAWFDLSVDGPRLTGRDPFLNPEWIRRRVADYLAGSIDPHDPRVSPSYANLTGLPPLYLQIAENDTVREGALQVAANALRSGVEVRMEAWPGMIHAWQALVGAAIPEAGQAWALIRQYLDQKIPPPNP